MNKDRERIMIPMFESPDKTKTIKRTCVICGAEYQYPGGTNYFWKGTKNPMGVLSVPKEPGVINLKDRIWPNDCCEEHRNYESIEKYIKDKAHRCPDCGKRIGSFFHVCYDYIDGMRIERPEKEIEDK